VKYGDAWDDGEAAAVRARLSTGRVGKLRRSVYRLHEDAAEMLAKQREEEAAERQRRRAEQERERAALQAAEAEERLRRIVLESRELQARQEREQPDPRGVVALAGAICKVAGIEPTAIANLLRRAYEHGVTDGTRAALARVDGTPLSVEVPYVGEDTNGRTCIDGTAHKFRAVGAVVVCYSCGRPAEVPQ
jgi:hypothetical protein